MTIERAVYNELKGVADSVAIASDRYLKNKAELVQSWSRQPGIQQAIIELVELADSDPGVEKLREAKQIGRIQSQLKKLSGFEDVKFVVWNDSFKTIASWQQDRADLGQPVQPGRASNLARVMAGETVLFGPERPLTNDDGTAPVTDQPVMAIIVPIQHDNGKIVAALLVRGIKMFDEFSRMFVDVALSGQLDAYSINREGHMLTYSPVAVSLAMQTRLEVSAAEIAVQLRVADPGVELTSENVDSITRAICPLTISAASATNGLSDIRIEKYNNYAGQAVVGAWRWHDAWNLGIIIEKDTKRAFAPVRIVRFGFVLLGSLLSITAFVAAARIACTSTAERAAVHPLSRYEILGELGTGGMGVVYRAKHRQLGRDTALKLLRSDRHNKEDGRRFDREARLAASLSNPHSVMIYDYGRSEEGEAYCVMEFLKGLTLQEVVARSGYQPIVGS